MSATIKLLDKYRKTCLTPSDNAIAVSLGLSRTAVSRWVNGAAHPDAEHIEKMAQAIGEEPGPWLVAIQAERTHGDKNKKAWLRLAATLGTTLALATVIVPSHAFGRLDVQTMTAYCVKFTHRLVASLWDAARSILRGHSRFGPYQAHMTAQALA